MDPLQSLALLLSILALALVLWGGRRTGVSPMLTLYWALFLVFWNILPLLLQATIVTVEPGSPGPWSRNALALTQSSLLVLLALLHVSFQRPYVTPVKQYFDEHAPDVARLFWPTVIALGILVASEFRLTSVVGTSFGDAVAFAVQSTTEERVQEGLIEMVLTLLLGYFVSLISFGREGGVSAGSLRLSWLGVILHSAFAISRGTRSVVLFPAIVGLVALGALRGRARRRAKIVMVVAVVLTILIGAPLALILGVWRGQSTSASREVATSFIESARNNLSFREQAVLVATEVNRKFDEVGPGVELLAMEPPGTGGATPILSAAVSPVPRMLFPSKPIPTSRNGTTLGLPYYIAATAYGDPDFGMVVPVSSTAVALWEFDTPGLLILVMINLLSLIVLNTVFIARNVLTRAVAVSVLAMPTLQGFVSPPSTVLQGMLRVAMFTFAVFACTLAVRLFRASGTGAGAGDPVALDG